MAKKGFITEVIFNLLMVARYVNQSNSSKHNDHTSKQNTTKTLKSLVTWSEWFSYG